MVKIVKIITGEEVVCEYKDNDNGTATVKNAARFVATHEGVGMMPLSPFSKDKEFTIKNEHVIFIGDVEDEIFNSWNSQYGSGLVLASGNVKSAKTLKIST